MSRITIDHNKWGQGDLNGNPSSVKTNGTSIKRFGPLGAAGSAGHVKNHGGEHEVVFELSGDSILTENGVNSSKVLAVEIPAFSVVTEAYSVTHQAFLSGGVMVGMTSQSAVGGASTDNPLFDSDAALSLEDNIALTLTLTPIDLKTFDEGGVMYIDFSNVTPNPDKQSGGQAEIVVKYRTV